MTREQIDTLVKKGEFSGATERRELVETHISWVIMCVQYVYKIKKPVHYSFLDFSTMGRRKYFCEREVTLNRRISGDVYIGVEPVSLHNGNFFIGSRIGEIIDYAVKMHKLDTEKQMDVLLSRGEVTTADMGRLAEKIATFHRDATVICNKDVLNIQSEFNDIAQQIDFLKERDEKNSVDLILRAINVSDNFIKRNRDLFLNRLTKGYYRDCHGDLHARNIFLLPQPVPFDCIEFNDDLRQIDVLNEVAFLCMDLDASGRSDLAQAFVDSYNGFFGAMTNEKDRSLFVYYKSYRANVRAKVNILRAKSSTTEAECRKALSATRKYLLLMETYLQSPEFL